MLHSEQLFDLKYIIQNNADACDKAFDFDKREIMISLDIGKIESKDSLFGFNIGMTFDPKKLYFDRAISTNTLSESMKYVKFTGGDPGKISGYAGNLSPTIPPSVGARPLIKLRFIYYAKCPDSAQVKLDYLEFTEEFKKGHLKDDSVKFFTDAKKIDSRIVKLKSKHEKIIFQNITEKSVTALIDYTDQVDIKTAQLEFKLEDNSNFVIQTVKSIHKDIEIVKSEIIASKLLVDLKINKIVSGLDILEINMKNKESKDVIENFTFNILGTNKCSCITDLKQSSMVLESKKENSVSELPNQILSIVETNNSVSIESFKKIDKIEIYNLIGQVITYKFNKYSAYVDLESYDHGIYFMIIYSGNTILDKKKLIKLNNN